MMCSAFFSGSETAFFSVNRTRLQRLSHEGREKATWILELLSKPRRLLLSILVGNEIVNVSVSAAATSLWIIILGQKYGPIVAFTSTVFFLVLFCEITPKSYAINNAEKFCNSYVKMMKSWLSLIYPIRVVLIKLYSFLFKVFKIDYEHEEDLVTAKDILSWLETHEDEKILPKDEYELIYHTLNLENKKAKDIMTPRTDFFAIDIKERMDNVIEKMKHPKHSRIPVYEGDVDHVVGLLYTKDLLGLEFQKPRRNLKNLLHKVEFVPGYMKLNELLVYFMLRKTHLAIVTDEYGGVDGLVSFEDILEELVGEIQDEFDMEEPMYTLIADNHYRISALMGIDDFNAQFKTAYEKINYDTIGGFLLDKFGKIPNSGEEIREGDMTFKVLKVEKNRIITIELIFHDGGSQ
ncbi:hemolysin family protein [bacterium]|nr:hemolysin family protein [bacterium]